MVENTRLFNKVYCYQYTPPCFPTPFAFTMNAGQRYYFDGAPGLLNVRVKAISVSYGGGGGPLIDPANAVFFTIADGKNVQRLTNFPARDLDYTNSTGLGSNLGRLRLFDLDGVNLQSCYFTAQATSKSYFVNGVFWRIYFYY